MSIMEYSNGHTNGTGAQIHRETTCGRGFFAAAPMSAVNRTALAVLSSPILFTICCAVLDSTGGTLQQSKLYYPRQAHNPLRYLLQTLTATEVLNVRVSRISQTLSGDGAVVCTILEVGEFLCYNIFFIQGVVGLTTTFSGMIVYMILMAKKYLKNSFLKYKIWTCHTS